MSNDEEAAPLEAGSRHVEADSRQGSLAQRLRELTEAAHQRSEEERLRLEQEAHEKALKIIANIEKLASEQAQIGNSHLAVMDVTYDKNPRYADTDGFIIDPANLTGAGRHVYEYCLREGLNPRLVSRWTVLMENVHRIDFSLVISW